MKKHYVIRMDFTEEELQNILRAMQYNEGDTDVACLSEATQKFTETLKTILID